MRGTQSMRGFTLLELLVAVALMSIVIVGVTATFQSMLRIYGDVRDNRQDAMQVRLCIGLLGDDLRTVSREDTFWGRVPSSLEDDARLMEFTGGISVHQDEAGPQWTEVRVTYRLVRTPDEDTWTLIRTERPYPSIFGAWKEEPMAVLEHVEHLRFTYENAQGVAQDSILIAPKSALPRSVRMELTLRRGDRTETYTARFPLGMDNL